MGPQPCRQAATRHYLVFSGRSWSIYREAGVPGNLKFDGAATETTVKSDSLSTGVQFWTAGFSATPSGPAGTTGLASSAIPSDGFGSGIGSGNCVDDAQTGPRTCRGSIAFCRVRGVPDMETGAVYLTSTRTGSRVEGILCNDASTMGSYQVQRWPWNAGAWSRK